MRSADDLRKLIEAPREYGVASPATFTSMSGIDVLQTMIDGKLPAPPSAKLLGFALTKVEQGYALFEYLPKPEHYNPLGSVHGGIISTLLDSAMGCAVQTTLPAGRGYVTLEFKVNFVRPVTVEAGPIRTEGRILTTGRRAATSEAKVLDNEGRLYSHATTTCLVFDVPAGAKD